MDHLRDQDLILAPDGELTTAIADHLEECATCRDRQAALAAALDAATMAHHSRYADRLPTAPLPLAQLRYAMASPEHKNAWPMAWVAAAAVIILAGTMFVWRSTHTTFTGVSPNRLTTPGAARAMGRESVCSADFTRPPIEPSVALAVFHKYGINNPPPGTYEVDYLIPPALGGSDDPRNLWPQPYSTGVWNARVKDALEDRLHLLVCSGKLDLAMAQRDLSRDWIAAYKKYFRTDKPLVDHAGFVKDPPWQ